jgi:hypothetical protein
MTDSYIVRELVSDLYREASPLLGDDCCDDYGFAHRAMQFVLAKAIVKFGNAEYGWAAILSWLDSPFDEVTDFVVYPINCRGTEIVKAISGVARGVFDPDNSELHICDSVE